MAPRCINFDIDPVDFPGGAANTSRRLNSVLLDRRQVHFTDSRNETTATAKSMGGHAMSITFWITDPPDISLFSVSCSSPPNHPTSDFRVLPHVVGAKGRFVLIRALFYSRYGRDEYFMYKAGEGESPSLDWVPLPPDDKDGSLGKVKELGIVLREHSDHYLLAALCDDRHAASDYQLRIYSSETKEWSTTTLANPCPGLRKIVPEKVITLGEGLLGWVDFSRGLVACDLLQDPPSVRFIPLPKPLPENKGKLLPGAARPFRDLACVNGVLKFVEMEHRVEEKLSDPTDKDVLCDSDLIMSLKCEDMDEKPESMHDWKVVTWSRTVWSNFWRKEFTVSVDDILVNESTHSSLVSGLRGKAAGKLTFRYLSLACPTLSIDGDDVLYFKSVADPSNLKGLVIALDLGNKVVKAHGGYCLDYSALSEHASYGCMLSCHLNRTCGKKCSSCCEIVQAGSSANDPNNKSICVGGPIPPWKFTGKLRRPLAEQTNRARIGDQSIAHDAISLIAPFPTHYVKSMMDTEREIIAEKIKRARMEGQGIVKSGHVSRVHPFQNNMQRLNKSHGPIDPLDALVGPAPNCSTVAAIDPMRQQTAELKRTLMP